MLQVSTNALFKCCGLEKVAVSASTTPVRHSSSWAANQHTVWKPPQPLPFLHLKNQGSYLI
jgi:hypothetical protein